MYKFPTILCQMKRAIYKSDIIINVVCSARASRPHLLVRVYMKHENNEFKVEACGMLRSQKTSEIYLK